MPCDDHEMSKKKQPSERELRLEAILHAASDAIVTIDGQGIIQSVNPATEKMFGYSAREMVGQNVSMLMPAPYRFEHDGYIRRYLNTLQPSILGKGREMSAQKKDGSVFPIQLSVTEVDHLGIFTGIIHDVSQRRELQRHILEISDEEQRRIGQELHDNIQQELVGLSLLAGTLTERLKSARQVLERPTAPDGVPQGDGLETQELVRLTEIADRISRGLVEASQHVRQLSHGILPSQVDAQGFWCALEELVDETHRMSGCECILKGVQNVTIPSNQAATNLYRIAQESINNSLRHSKATRIDICLSLENGLPCLEIADNGLGFETSSGSDDSRTPSRQMGIKIMEYRARAIGAVFQVDSVLGRGTRVVCKLQLGTVATS